MTNSTDLKSRLRELLLEGSPTVLASNPGSDTHELQKMPSEKWESLDRSKRDQLKKIVSRRNDKVLNEVNDEQLSSIMGKVEELSTESNAEPSSDAESHRGADANEETPETKDPSPDPSPEPETLSEDPSTKDEKEEEEEENEEKEESESEDVKANAETEPNPPELETAPQDANQNNTTSSENEQESSKEEPAPVSEETNPDPPVSEPEIEPLGIEADEEEENKAAFSSEEQTDLDLTPNFVNTFFSYVNSLMDKPVEVPKTEVPPSAADNKSSEIVNSTPDYSDPSVFEESKTESDEDKPLPEGWEKHVSKTSNPGQAYYFNSSTGETRWEHPGSSSESEENKENVSNDSASLPPGWTAHVSESSDPGKTYYHNAETGETVWEKPVAASSEEDPLPPGWTAHVSESSDPGKTYYHNAETGETVWEKPTAASQGDSADLGKHSVETEGATKDAVEGQCYKCGGRDNLNLKTYRLTANGAQPVHFCSFKCFEGIEF
jgi:hypothetical protein